MAPSPRPPLDSDSDVRLETILVIHGTYATESIWWRENSEFAARLDESLRQRGSTARCWAHAALGVPPYTWSGLNSETARLRAADELVAYLLILETDDRIPLLPFNCT